MKQVSMMYEISVFERKYINSEDSSVEVSFQLPGRDWNELLQSSQWKGVENFLSQKKSIETYDSKIIPEFLRSGKKV